MTKDDLVSKDTALKMAIEAMTLPNNLSFLMAITACKEALEHPSWQGLSDNEKLAIIRKWKDAHTMREQELIGLGDAFEQALKEKNT